LAGQLLHHGTAPIYQFTETKPAMMLPPCFIERPSWLSSKGICLRCDWRLPEQIVVDGPALPRRIPTTIKLLSHEGLANAESADLRFADLLVSSPLAKHSFDNEATSIFSCSGPRSRYGE
jgi:hypothetical protein